jgi:ankyrin repeat protein
MFLMLEGANPNLQSPNVLHTPLHWLAYWGDHRAVEQLLEYNQIDYV